MAHNPDKATRTNLQAFQDAIGVNIADVVEWVFPMLASVWLWTVIATGRLELTPVRWCGEVLASLGVGDQWARTADVWLATRPALFPVLILCAALLSGLAARGRLALNNLVTIVLFSAMSMHSGVVALRWFVAATLGACAIAIALDYVRQRLAGAEKYSWQPRLSFEMWCWGAGRLIATWLFGPLRLLYELIKNYRVPAVEIDDRRPSFRAAAEQLPNVPLTEVPADDALAFLAHAILVAGDADQRRTALRGLALRSQGAVIGSPERYWPQLAEADRLRAGKQEWRVKQ
ncbi:hypothetical protein ACFWU5_28845 [Nocardia sp. NPDC058640]|uniref:hypothetical protein n=1 Tax=Nocardia sp. NPDC058640 TaxID=3346571 RepID=UPI00364BA9D6